MTTEIEGEVSLDQIARLVRAAGHPCRVEQTGGNVQTLMAGAPRIDADGDARFPVLAGPGWLDEECNALGHVADLHVGPDDDGESEGYSASRYDDERSIADVVLAMIGAA